MPRRPITLTDALAAQIKSRLWGGETAQAISDGLSTLTLRVTVDTIRAIAAGVRWRHTPWPDESTGKLSIRRRRQISDARMRVLRDSTAAIRRILDA